MFGVNPWKLMTWMGHKGSTRRCSMSTSLVGHLRPLPEPIKEAQRNEEDPDLKVLAMLSARHLCEEVRGKTMAKNDEDYLQTQKNP